MKRLYSDMNHVLDSLSKATSHHDEGELAVYDAGDAQMIALTRATVEDRNLLDTEFERVDDLVCTIEFRVTEIATLLELGFHESEVDSALEFRPAGPAAIAPTQATSPVSLGDRLGEALAPLAQEGAVFTFKGVEAASMASGGHYTSFEYDYSIDGLEV